MTIALSELNVKVKVVGQANAVGPTLIEGSFFSCTNSPQQIEVSLYAGASRRSYNSQLPHDALIHAHRVVHKAGRSVQ